MGELMKRFLVFLTLFICAIAGADSPTEAEVLAQLKIGPTWDKVEVDSALLQTLSVPLRQVALSTANFQHGTAFYLGRYRNRFVMATNAHVVAKNASDLVGDLSSFDKDPSLICKNQYGVKHQVRFGLQDKTFECGELIAVIPSVELAIFTIDVNGGDESFFDQLGAHFGSAKSDLAGEPIAIFGYGEFMNPGVNEIKLVTATSAFCQTFSSLASPNLMNDPDEHSPAPYRVW